MTSNSEARTGARIWGVGAGAPALRVTTADIGAAWGRSGRSQIAACAPDEDTLTLAWDAASAALDAAGVEADAVDAILWGTSRPPFAEGPSLAFLAAALGLAANVEGALVCGSTHSGMEALNAGTDMIAAGSAGVALVVVSDALRPGLGTGFETRCGAGAAAVVLGAHGGAATLGRRVTNTRPFVDRYRGDGESDNRDLYDARLFREEIFLPSVEGVGRELAQSSVSAWSLPDPDGRLGAVIAKTLGAATLASGAVYASVGDTGAAAALLGGARRARHARGGCSGRHGRRSHNRRARGRPRAGAGRESCWRGPRCRPARLVRRAVTRSRPTRSRRRDHPNGCASGKRAVRTRR